MNDFSNGDSVFVPSHSLIGHEDWVRSLDFISEGKYCVWLTILQNCYDSFGCMIKDNHLHNIYINMF